jgi:hypothetical protein
MTPAKSLIAIQESVPTRMFHFSRVIDVVHREDCIVQNIEEILVDPIWETLAATVIAIRIFMFRLLNNAENG